MLPSQKCVSLETARKLQAAGFPQETERYFMHDDNFKTDELWERTHWETVEDEWGSGRNFDSIEKIAAPDAQEIGELLPGGCGFEKQENQWACHPPGDYEAYEWIYADTEANVRAAMWLSLKEQKLI